MMATTYRGSWIPIFNARLYKHHHFDKLQSTSGELEKEGRIQAGATRFFVEDLQKCMSVGISLF